MIYPKPRFPDHLLDMDSPAQTSAVTAPEDRVPFGQKVAYGIGMLGNQMFPAALGVFLSLIHI